eukprot:7963152-Pyramimonas_sp.AAC.1
MLHRTIRGKCCEDLRLKLCHICLTPKKNSINDAGLIHSKQMCPPYDLGMRVQRGRLMCSLAHGC